ncbi:MAG: Methylmalonyl-CoA carboxyltransferase 1.3S subunit [bacterium ADurb.Bin243]|nr:MAG: Methylmalonyl-CoA carboxyltransferase 1.3S subunit [bacterium ADurb.Bin243]
MIRKYIVKIGKESFEVEVQEMQTQSAAPTFQPNVIVPPTVLTAPLPTPKPKVPLAVPRQKSPSGGKTINAIMSGSIIAVLVKEGDEIKENDAVVKLEAMKMETIVNSPFTGKVKEILVNERQAVTAGDMLIVVE